MISARMPGSRAAERLSSGTRQPGKDTGMGDDTAIVRVEGILVFLARSPTAAQSPPEVLEQAGKGVGQFAIIVDDVDAVCAEIAGRGVQSLAGPADRDWGMRTATFADPGGHIWEIAQELPSADG